MKLTDEHLRLYAVTDRTHLHGQSLLQQVEQALAGGVTLVQLREKTLPLDTFARTALEMARLCHRYGVPLVINDHVQIAKQSGADGVHVGQGDMDAAAARRTLGRDMIIGVTAKTVAQALRAQQAGADYLGSGAVFGSQTKQDALPMTKACLASICGAVSIPVVAIGGIHRGNIAQLTGAPIAGVAVASGIFAAQDICGECRHLRAMVQQIVSPGCPHMPRGM